MNIQKIRESLYETFPQFECQFKFEEITDVIVLWGSSRSGSSLAYNTLANHPDILGLQGEDSTFYRLHGYAQINSELESDELNEKLNINYSILRTEILRDLRAKNLTSESEVEKSFHNVQRFILQWPNLHYSQEELIKLIEQKVSFPDLMKHFNVTKEFYESDLIHSQLIPEQNLIIEEPPYIIPQYLKKEIGKRKILLLKSSSNIYRSNYIFNLFPQANYHQIILRRKPESSINGLIDGWHSSGFHSHFLAPIKKLTILDYQDNSWWKFDLPPGWSQYTNSKLEEVCAFQWKSASKKLLQLAQNESITFLDYENVFTPELYLEKINQFLNAIKLPPFKSKIELPLVMSTKFPSENRWESKKELITNLIQKHNLKELYEELHNK